MPAIISQSRGGFNTNRQRTAASFILEPDLVAIYTNKKKNTLVSVQATNKIDAYSLLIEILMLSLGPVLCIMTALSIVVLNSK